MPLWRLLGGERREIPCGVSIGIQPSIEALLAKVRHEVSAGYRRVKIKIKPGWEVEPLRAIRSEFPDLPLMADANSAFQLSDLDLLRRLDAFALMMIEQPLAHDDIVDHAVLQRELQTPICLDESICSAADARKAVELGSCRIINVKLGRVGGYEEARMINSLLRAAQDPALVRRHAGKRHRPRAQHRDVDACPGFTLPGDVSASKRYYEEDTVNPPVAVTPSGTILVPESPGIGFIPDPERIERATVRHRQFNLE